MDSNFEKTINSHFSDLKAQEANLVKQLDMVRELISYYKKNMLNESDSDDVQKKVSKQIIKQSNKDTAITKSPHELEDASGAEIFLWGLEKLKNGGTVGDVVEVVSKLDIDRVQERIENNTLKQWMAVSAQSLEKSKGIERYSRKDRKGVFYRIAD